MTKKRFEIKQSITYNDKSVILDGEKEYTFPILDNTLCYMFCKAMNELHEENIRLKRDFDSCSHNWGLIYDEAKNKVEELSKENEQLKETIDKLRKTTEKEKIAKRDYTSRGLYNE